jgi:hypothetical protein
VIFAVPTFKIARIPEDFLTTNGRELTRIKAEHSCLFAVVFRRLWLRLRRAVRPHAHCRLVENKFDPIADSIITGLAGAPAQMCIKLARIPVSPLALQSGRTANLAQRVIK